MLLVNSEADIRAFIPNIFKSAIGETDLYSKITAFILEAERFALDKVISKNVLETLSEQCPDLIPHIKGMVVCHAAHLALPSLDSVLTPNGIAVVSTQTLAPASKERVAALDKSLVNMRDSYMNSALIMLEKHEVWRKSPQGLKWHRTLFHDIDFTRRFCEGMVSYRKFLELESLIQEQEMWLAMNFFSPELMAALRVESDSEDDRGQITRMIRAQMINLLSNVKVPVHRFMDIVQFIRQSPESFPEWHSSETAKLFQSSGFVNTASSGGYWF